MCVLVMYGYSMPYRSAFIPFNFEINILKKACNTRYFFTSYECM